MATSIIEGDSFTSAAVENIFNNDTEHFGYMLRKTGKIVNIFARLYNLRTYPYANFFRVPEGFRPKGTVAIVGYVFMEGETGNNITWVEVGSDGVIRFEYSPSRYCTQVGVIGTYSV